MEEQNDVRKMSDEQEVSRQSEIPHVSPVIWCIQLAALSQSSFGLPYMAYQNAVPSLPQHSNPNSEQRPANIFFIQLDLVTATMMSTLSFLHHRRELTDTHN